MQQKLWPSDDHRPRQVMRRLDRVFGEINVFLLTVAIGLAVLDYTCFVALNASTAIARVQQNRISAPSPSPSRPMVYR